MGLALVHFQKYWLLKYINSFFCSNFNVELFSTAVHCKNFFSKENCTVFPIYFSLECWFCFVMKKWMNFIFRFDCYWWGKLGAAQDSVQPKPGFGIRNWNHGPISVTASELIFRTETFFFSFFTIFFNFLFPLLVEINSVEHQWRLELIHTLLSNWSIPSKKGYGTTQI
jgi:hypothetical protein